MIPKHVFKMRRLELERKVGASILLVGNTPRYRNFPAVELPFRQDSTFLYYLGYSSPSVAAILSEGRCVLYIPEPAPDDSLWKGESESEQALKERLGVDELRYTSRLADDCQSLGIRHSLSVADPKATALAAQLTGLELGSEGPMGPDALVDAVIEMRRSKGPEEIQELEEAVRITTRAYDLVMKATRVGEHEASMGALYEACLAAHGATAGYGSILTVHGEVLHNESRLYPLEDGGLFLVDAGAEVPSGYTCDVTRVWPINGRFSARQRSAYDAVLAANCAGIELCRPGVRYRQVHDQASRVMARWLRDEGLLLCDEDRSIETGAHAMFFPHGVGHLLGMDVHDLRGFGDRAAYAPGRTRSSLFGTGYLRLDRDLEPGYLVTVEPGFYIVPAILRNPSFRETFKGLVDFDKAQEWLGFGGIRIEDDILVTQGDPLNLTAGIPKDPQILETIVGTGPSARERLLG